jgi:transposase-like protein
MANDATVRLEFSRNQQVENLLTQWRIHWEYVEDYDLDSIQNIEGQQVRLGGLGVADGEIVAQYAEQARNGAKFPPLVVRREPSGHHSMMDGNTRKAMAQTLGQKTFPVYVANVASLDLANSVAASLNQLGGVRLTEAEATRAALVMLGLSLTDGEIAQAVGRTASQIRNWRKTHEAEEHAKALGINESFADLPPRQKLLLARVVQDQPFKSLVEFGTGRRVTNPNWKALVDEVVKAPSESEALESIAEAKAALPVSGPSGKADVANPKVRHMRMILPQVINMHPAEELYDSDRADVDEAAWHEVAKVVERMLAMYARHRGETLLP